MGRARIEGEHWAEVSDLRKRKQIQDRLAQRARRDRLKQAQKKFSCECGSDDQMTSSSSTTSPSSEHQNEIEGFVHINQHPAHYEVPATTISGKSLYTGQFTASVYQACYVNGAILGLMCSVSFIGPSAPVGPDVPESLRPTPLQLTVPHPPWIDRFPFPRMRDNMITLLGLIDEEGFLADLFCLTSFTIRNGAPSWDPSAWKIGPEFSAKWGYLFD